MLKLLLVGELNDTLHSLSECLRNDFQVQMCSVNAKNVNDMVRIIRPSVLVFNILKLGSEVDGVIEILGTKLNNMPLLIIADTDKEQAIHEKIAGFKKTMVILRPLMGRDVLEGCYKLLESESSVNVNPKSTKEEHIGLKKILVVDDNALVLRNIKNMLGGEYEIILANSGEKALSFINTKKPDMVILDYNMPGMNGKQVFESIKSDDEYKELPVIFLSSVAEKNQIMSVLKNRPYRYILKPPEKDKLVRAIKEAFGE